MKINKINKHNLNNYLQLFWTTYTELKFLLFFIFFIIIPNFVLSTKKIFWTSVQIMLIRIIIDKVYGETCNNDYKP